MGLEFSLAICPGILIDGTKCLSDGNRSALDFIEIFDSFFDNLHNIIKLDIYFDETVGIVWNLVSIRFYKLCSLLQINILNNSFESIFGAKVKDLEDIIDTTSDEYKNQLYFLILPIDIPRNHPAMMDRVHIQR